MHGDVIVLYIVATQIVCELESNSDSDDYDSNHGQTDSKIWSQSE